MGVGPDCIDRGRVLIDAGADALFIDAATDQDDGVVSGRDADLMREDPAVKARGLLDFFTEPSLVPNPHPYFDYLREKGPVTAEPHHGVVAVTGYNEAMALYKDVDSFSSCIAVGGPFPPLPFEPSGDDISDLVAQHRSRLPLHEHMVTMDPPDHTRSRSLLSRLLTPARLKENQDFLRHANPWALHAMVEKLSEAADRGLWAEPDPELMDRMQQVYLDVEGDLEDRVS